MARDDDAVPPCWLIQGLTTNPTYSDGKPRTPITEPVESGLNGPGYLWAPHLTNIHEDSITWHPGYPTSAFIDGVLSGLVLDSEDRSWMRAWMISHGTVDE